MSTVSDDIVKGFLYKLQNDPQLKTILKGIKANGGDYKDAEKYAGRAGQLLTEVFKANITSSNFPVGSVKDIASLIVPAMELNYNAITQVTGMVQKSLNKDGGIGMNSVNPKFNRSSALNLVGRMAKYESFEDAAWMLEEPMQTAALGVTDDTLRKNADFQYKSGMKPKIIRTCESDACELCQMLAGEYDYEEVKDRSNPVWQRHNNCQCEITFDPGEGKTSNAHSKRGDDGEASLKRITVSNGESKKYQDHQAVNKTIRLNSFDNGGGGNYNKTPTQELKLQYDEDVADGWISALSGFDNYLRQYRYLERNAIGIKTANGIEVTEISRHFMQRVIGTGVDPKIYRDDLRIVHRDGTEPKDIIETLKCGIPRPPQYKNGDVSQVIIGKCFVTINPNTGCLVQCNRRARR